MSNPCYMMPNMISFFERSSLEFTTREDQSGQKLFPEQNSLCAFGEQVHNGVIRLTKGTAWGVFFFHFK